MLHEFFLVFQTAVFVERQWHNWSLPTVFCFKMNFVLKCLTDAPLRDNLCQSRITECPSHHRYCCTGCQGFGSNRYCFIYLATYSSATLEIRGETRYLGSSVTRFGEILPLWYNFKSLEQIFEGLFDICQKYKLTLAKMLCYWASFHCCRWPHTLK